MSETLHKEIICADIVGAEEIVKAAAARLSGLAAVQSKGKRIALAYRILADLQKQKEIFFNGENPSQIVPNLAPNLP